MFRQRDTVERCPHLPYPVSRCHRSHQDDRVFSCQLAAEVQKERDKSDEGTAVKRAAQQIQCDIGAQCGYQDTYDLQRHGDDDHIDAAIAMRPSHPEYRRGDPGDPYDKPPQVPVSFQPLKGVDDVGQKCPLDHKPHPFGKIGQDQENDIGGKDRSGKWMFDGLFCDRFIKREDIQGVKGHDKGKDRQSKPGFAPGTFLEHSLADQLGDHDRKTDTAEVYPHRFCLILEIELDHHDGSADDEDHRRAETCDHPGEQPEGFVGARSQYQCREDTEHHPYPEVLDFGVDIFDKDGKDRTGQIARKIQ